MRALPLADARHLRLRARPVLAQQRADGAVAEDDRSVEGLLPTEPAELGQHPAHPLLAPLVRLDRDLDDQGELRLALLVHPGRRFQQLFGQALGLTELAEEHLLHRHGGVRLRSGGDRAQAEGCFTGEHDLLGVPGAHQFVGRQPDLRPQPPDRQPVRVRGREHAAQMDVRVLEAAPPGEQGEHLTALAGGGRQGDLLGDPYRPQRQCLGPGRTVVALVVGQREQVRLDHVQRCELGR